MGSMKRLSPTLNCPACQQTLRPAVMACDACSLRVEGHFELNEFSRLSNDELHFLRIFIQCEGRIRDMEAALGLSYPTIRARLTAFKERVQNLATEMPPSIDEENQKVTPAKPASSPAAEILNRLKSGSLDYEQALKEIKKSTNRAEKSKGEKK